MLFDLTVAAEVGMVLVAIAFIKRVADVPPGVIIDRGFGALRFGPAEKRENIIRCTGGDTQVVILHMAAVTAMDATALNRIENLHAKLRRHGKYLVLSGPHTQPYFMLEKAGFFDALGRENIGADLEAAVARARELLLVPGQVRA